MAQKKYIEIKPKVDQAPDFIPDTSASAAPDFIPDASADSSQGNGKLQPQGDLPGEKFNPYSDEMPDFRDPHQAGKFGLNLLEGVGEGALNTVHGVGEGIRKIGNFGSRNSSHPGEGDRLIPPVGQNALSKIATPDNTIQSIGKFGEQAGEFMIPGEAEESALAHIPQAVNKFKPVARILLQGADSGIINKAQGGSFKEGAEGGAFGAGVGEGARAVAPHLAESAMKITRRAREFGRTPGAAILEDTTGVRPATVARKAGQAIARKTSQMESLVNDATNAGKTGTTLGARSVLDSEIAKAPRNARGFSEGLHNLGDLLHFDNPSSLGPRRVTYTPNELLEMKRGIGTEVSNWNPEMRKGLGPVSRKLYSPIDKEVDRLAPGTEELNQHISSLIPARDFMQRRALGAGIAQRVADRALAHTGALAGTIAGGTYGYHKDGVPGMVGYGLSGLVLPEVLASPGSQMTMARGAFKFPRRLTTGLTMQAIRKLRENNGDEENGDTR
jgi:hypothetical protein